MHPQQSHRSVLTEKGAAHQPKLAALIPTLWILTLPCRRRQLATVFLFLRSRFPLIRVAPIWRTGRFILKRAWFDRLLPSVLHYATAVIIAWNVLVHELEANELRSFWHILQ